MSSLVEQLDQIQDAVRELLELVGADSEIIKSPTSGPTIKEIEVDHDNATAGVAPAVTIPAASLDAGIDEVVPHVASPPTAALEEAVEVVPSAIKNSSTMLHSMCWTECPSYKGATLTSRFTPYSTSSHGESNIGMQPLTPWSVSASFTYPPKLWPAQSCWLSVVLELDTKLSSRCLTTCLINHTELFVYMSMENVIPSIMRPRPWPTFIGDHAAHGESACWKFSHKIVHIKLHEHMRTKN